jgi:hypothetical protein
VEWGGAGGGGGGGGHKTFHVWLALSVLDLGNKNSGPRRPNWKKTPMPQAWPPTFAFITRLRSLTLEAYNERSVSEPGNNYP